MDPEETTDLNNCSSDYTQEQEYLGEQALSGIEMLGLTSKTSMKIFRNIFLGILKVTTKL